LAERTESGGLAREVMEDNVNLVGAEEFPQADEQISGQAQVAQSTTGLGPLTEGAQDAVALGECSSPRRGPSLRMFPLTPKHKIRIHLICPIDFLPTFNALSRVKIEHKLSR